MQLFVKTLTREINSLHKNNVRVRFIGDHSDFVPELRAEMHERTEILQIAENFGAKVTDYGQDSMMLRVFGASEKLDAGCPIRVATACSS